MKPPAVARMLLLAMVGEQQAEFVDGDLHEEFLLLCESRGRGAGSRWYVRQVLRSSAALLGLRFRSGEASQLMAAAILAVAMPLMLLDRLWRFVYSQIPLKDGLHRAPGFWMVSIAYVFLCAALCGSLARSSHRAVGVALATAAAAACALWIGSAVTPGFYAALVIGAGPTGSLVTFAWRRSR